MNSKNQIKTHFDSKVIIFFMITFIISCGLLAFKKANEVNCDLASFETDVNQYRVGDLITFYDNSKSSYSWRWYFGDGTDISFRSKVGHVFTKPGKFKVTLKVNETCDVEKTILVLPKSVEVIKEKLIVDFESPMRVTQGDWIQFEDKTSGSESWEWKFGESGKTDSKSKNPKYAFRTIGVKTISLVINNDTKNIMFKDIVVTSRVKGTKTIVRKAPERKQIDTIKAIPEPKVIVPVKTISETELTNMLYSISEDKLTLSDFKNNFCQASLPKIKLQDGKYCTLDQLYKSIRNKGIKIRKVTIYKQPDTCIETIFVSYKYKTFF